MAGRSRVNGSFSVASLLEAPRVRFGITIKVFSVALFGSLSAELIARRAIDLSTDESMRLACDP
jgi:hypothetical protein